MKPRIRYCCWHIFEQSSDYIEGYKYAQTEFSSSDSNKDVKYFVLVFYYFLSCINYTDFLSASTRLRPCYLSIKTHIFLEQIALNRKWMSITFLLFQFLVTSILDDYSYLCQPVDYSQSELGMRVQFCARLALSPAPPAGMQIVLLINSNLHA